MVETALNGIEVTDVYEADRVTAVLVRLPEEYRQRRGGGRDLLVDAPTGERIPLSELADIRRSEGPQTIFRENLMRRKIILCNVVGRDIGQLRRGGPAADRSARWRCPPGYFVTFGGQFESQQRAMRHLTRADAGRDPDHLRRPLLLASGPSGRRCSSS